MKHFKFIFIITIALSFTMTTSVNADNPSTGQIIQLKQLAEKRLEQYNDLKSLLCRDTWDTNFWENFGVGFLADFGRIHIDRLIKENIERYTEKEFKNTYEEIIVNFATDREHVIAFFNALLGVEFPLNPYDALEWIFTALDVVTTADSPTPDLSVSVAVLMVKTAVYYRDIAKDVLYRTVFQYLNETDIRNSVIFCDPELIVDVLTACPEPTIGNVCQKLQLFFTRNNYFNQIKTLINQEISEYNKVITGISTIDQVKTSLYNIYKQQMNVLDDGSGNGLIDSDPSFYQRVWYDIADNLKFRLPDDNSKQMIITEIKAIGYYGALFFKMDKALLEELMYRLNPSPFSEYDIKPTNGYIEMAEVVAAINDWKDGNLTIGEVLTVSNLWKNGERSDLE